MTITKTFAADGVSDSVGVRPGEEVTIVFTVADAETFTGLMLAETSTDLQSWQTATDTSGAAVSHGGAAIDVVGAETFTHTVRNGGLKPFTLRLRVSDYDGDNVVATLTETAGEDLEVLLVNSANEPVLWRTDSGLRMAGALQAGSVEADDVNGIRLVTGTISAADIVATAAGKLGHAQGYPVVAAVANYTHVLEFGLFEFEFDTAAYTDGGNLTLNHGAGGAALTGLVSAANSLGAAASAKYVLRPLAVAGAAHFENKGINLVSSAAFTDPGTAVGVVNYTVAYRSYKTS